MTQKTIKNIPRRNKYILEDILLNIFKFYILKYITKFLQSHDNNKKKIFSFHNFAEHRLRISELKCCFVNELLVDDTRRKKTFSGGKGLIWSNRASSFWTVDLSYLLTKSTKPTWSGREEFLGEFSILGARWNHANEPDLIEYERRTTRRGLTGVKRERQKLVDEEREREKEGKVKRNGTRDKGRREKGRKM